MSNKDNPKKPDSPAPGQPGGGDWEKTRDPADFTAAVEAEILADKAKEKNPITDKFVTDCLYANELGDGILFAALNRDRFIFNKDSGQWLTWAGHHWEVDTMDSATAQVEGVAETYLKLSDPLVRQIAETKNKEDAATLEKKRDTITKRVRRLRNTAGRVATLNFAHTNPVNPIEASIDWFDRNPMMLACQNGVIDLETGELRPGKQDQYMLKACQVEYKGVDEPADAWEKFLLEVFEDDENIVAYVQRMFGYCLTGKTSEHALPIFNGRGRNGKGTIIETIKNYVMGELCSPIRAEMLLNQGHSRSSAGASSDIMALRGLRLAYASETDEGRQFSASRIKWLTGGDTLVGRAPYDRRETEFLPTHKLILSTNDLPHVSPNDYAFWERVHVVPFRLSFVRRKPNKEFEREADGELPQTLGKEAAGILAWMIRGSIAWQADGLNPPKVITRATGKYRRNEDNIADWVDDCCDQAPEYETQFSSLYSSFRLWWKNNISNRPLTRHKFGRSMGEKFEKKKKGRISYKGVALNDIALAAIEKSKQ